MKRLLALALFALLVLLPLASVPTEAEAEGYTDGYTLIGDVSIPFENYMPGTFFTKNGAACTCHYDQSIDCVANGPRCNCLRYVDIDGIQVDLLSVQCIGFARYCFYRLFGFLDSPYTDPDKYYNAGSIPAGQVTAGSVKQLFSALKPGAHIRFRLSASEHSVILLSQNDGGFTVYQCNAGGNGVESSSCVVSTKSYTWESFASYAYRGIVFANMPYDYPERLEYSPLPFETSPRESGVYTTTDNLKLREEPDTESAWLDTISAGTRIYVAEISGGWGRVVYNGKLGYISLAYARYTSEAPKLVPTVGDVEVLDGYAVGVPAGTGAAELAAMFTGGVIDTSLAGGETAKTGSFVHIKEGSDVVYTAIVVVRGDVNGDGFISTADCASIQNILTGGAAKRHFILAADVNGDGSVNTPDYKRLRLDLSLG